MSRISRPQRDMAFLRGRPKTLRFPAPGVKGSPKPVLELHGYYLINGEPIHFIGQRWKASDAAHSPTPTDPDPMQPGIMITSRLEDADGQIIQAVSYEAWRAATLARLAGCKAPAAGTSSRIARR